MNPVYLLLFYVVIALADKRTEYYGQSHSGSHQSQGPVSFSHYVQDHAGHHSSNKVPLVKVPISVKPYHPVSFVTPVPYYLERSLHLPVKEVPVLTKVPLVYQVHAGDGYLDDQQLPYQHLHPFYHH